MQNKTKACLNYEGEYHRLLEINNALECKCKLLSDDLEKLHQDNKSLEEQYKSLENTLAESEKESIQKIKNEERRIKEAEIARHRKR